MQEIGISVWGQDHKVIEQQALAELEKLKEVQSEKPSETKVKAKAPILGLDLERYIESQKQLSLAKKPKPKVVDPIISTQSLEYAEKISKHHTELAKQKDDKKRKLKACEEPEGVTSKKKYKSVQKDSDEEIVSENEYIPKKVTKKVKKRLKKNLEGSDSEGEIVSSGSEYLPSDEDFGKC